MNRDLELKSALKEELEATTTAIEALSQKFQGDSLALLSLLRVLEHLHREIREGAFQESLPDNRQQLYSLLKDIEESGGWPYIDRMKLRSLLVHLLEATDEDPNPPQEEAGNRQ